MVSDKIQEYVEGDLISSYFWLYIGEQIVTQLKYVVDIPIYQSSSCLSIHYLVHLRVIEFLKPVVAL